MALLEVSKQPRNGLAGSTNHLRDFFVREGEFEAWLLLHRLAVLRTPLDQQLGELFCRGVRQTERTDLMAGDIVFFAELLRYLETGVAVVLEEVEKVLAFDEIDLAGIDGFGGQLVGLAGNGGTEAKDFAGFGNFENESLTVTGTNGKFDAAFAKNKDAAGGLAFDEQDGAFGVGSGILDGLK